MARRDMLRQQIPEEPIAGRVRRYRQVNQRGWTKLAANGCASSRPYGPTQFAQAKVMLDPDGVIPWNEVRSVLCLGAGGGQQAPLFASMACEVVSADLCAEQLRRDEAVARRHGLAIECVQVDMLDLSMLYGCGFDLVFQAVSACYVPDVCQLYNEVAKVLRPGGLYRVEHWNPLHLQLADNQSWNGEAYQVARPQESGVPIPWHDADSTEPTCLHYIHTLGDLFGGLCRAGFAVIDFSDMRHPVNAAAPPGSNAHLASFIPPFFTLLSRRLPKKRPV
jgi:SAM-dependent methyltransferase